jgi:hypothetical protein
MHCVSFLDTRYPEDGVADYFDRKFFLCEQELHGTIYHRAAQFHTAKLVEESAAPSSMNEPMEIKLMTTFLSEYRNMLLTKHRRFEERRADYHQRVKRQLTLPHRQWRLRGTMTVYLRGTLRGMRHTGRQHATKLSPMLLASRGNPALRMEQLWCGFSHDEICNLPQGIQDKLFRPLFDMHYNLESRYCRRNVTEEIIRYMRQAAPNKIIGWEAVENQVHRTYAHISDEDPTKIAYAPSFAYAQKDRMIRTSVGKYLGKLFPSLFNQQQLQAISEKYQLAHTPPTLHMTPNTDADGWEWVYEHATGFTSCMMYNRPSDRYLAVDACGANHPVRAYAHPANKLSLAWIGIPGVEVWARCIVNTENKTMIRVFGDQRIGPLLEAAGYKHDAQAALFGQTLCIMPRASNPGEIYLPYFDASCTVAVLPTAGADHLIVVNGENYNGSGGSSSGVTYMPTRPLDQQSLKCEDEDEDDDDMRQCDCCGDDTHDDNLTYIEDDDANVCAYCRDRHYVFGIIGRRHHEGYMHDDNAVHCVSDDRYYHDNFLDFYDLVEIGGEYYKQTDDRVTYLSYCDEWVLVDDVTALDFEFGDDSFAHSRDVVTDLNCLTMHEDDAVTCDLSGNQWHRSVMWSVGSVTFYPQALLDDIELVADFCVIKKGEDFYLWNNFSVSLNPDIGPAPRPFRDWLLRTDFCPDRYILRNIAMGDDAERQYGILLQLKVVLREEEQSEQLAA